MEIIDEKSIWIGPAKIFPDNPVYQLLCKSGCSTVDVAEYACKCFNRVELKEFVDISLSLVDKFCSIKRNVQGICHGSIELLKVVKRNAKDINKKYNLGLDLRAEEDDLRVFEAAGVLRIGQNETVVKSMKMLPYCCLGSFVQHYASLGEHFDADGSLSLEKLTKLYNFANVMKIFKIFLGRDGRSSHGIEVVAGLCESSESKSGEMIAPMYKFGSEKKDSTIERRKICAAESISTSTPMSIAVQSGFSSAKLLENMFCKVSKALPSSPRQVRDTHQAERVSVEMFPSAEQWIALMESVQGKCAICSSSAANAGSQIPDAYFQQCADDLRDDFKANDQDSEEEEEEEEPFTRAHITSWGSTHTTEDTSVRVGDAAYVTAAAMPHIDGDMRCPDSSPEIDHFQLGKRKRQEVDFVSSLSPCREGFRSSESDSEDDFHNDMDGFTLRRGLYKRNGTQ